MTDHHDEGEVLTAPQVRALVAILQGKGYTAAAKEAGVSRSTLWDWRHDPKFRRRLNEERAQLLETLTGRLQQAGLEAVDTLLDVLKDEDASAGARQQAADSILRRVVGTKTDLSIDDSREVEQRIVKSEEKVEEFEKEMEAWQAAAGSDGDDDEDG